MDKNASTLYNKKIAKEKRKKLNFFGLNSKMILTIFASIFFIFTLLIVYFINKKYYFNAFFDPDGAAELMLGKLLSETGGIFTKDWYYSTEFRVLHNQIILKFLFKFSNNPLIVQPYMAAICALLMGGSTFFCFKTMNLPSWKALLAGSMIIMPLSSNYFMFFLASCYYSFFVINTFLYIGFFILSTNKKNTYILKISRLILLLLSFFMGLCGPRYFLLVFIPIFLYTAIELFQINDIYSISDIKKEKVKIQKTHILLVSISIVLAFLGYLIYSKILIQTYNARSLTDIASFVNPKSIMEKIYQIPEMFLTVLGIQDVLSVFSRQGIVQIVKIGFVVYSVYSLYILHKKRQYLGENVKKYFSISISIVIVNLAILIFLGGIFESGQALVPRYFLLGIFPILLIGILIIDDAIIDKPKQIISILMIIAMVTTSAYSVRLYARSMDYSEKTSLLEVVDYLEEQDFTLGYASFGYASPITLLSDYSAETITLIIDTLDTKANNGNYKLVPQKWLYPVDFDDIYYEKKGQYVVLNLTENQESEWIQFITEKDGKEIFTNNHFIVYSVSG